MDISSTLVIHGLKTVATAVVTYAIATALNLEFGCWTVIATVIVKQAYVADSVAMCPLSLFRHPDRYPPGGSDDPRDAQNVLFHRHTSLIYRKTFRETFSRKFAVLNQSAAHLRNRVRSLNALDDEGCEIIMTREREKIAGMSGKALVMFVK